MKSKTKFILHKNSVGTVYALSAKSLRGISVNKFGDVVSMSRWQPSSNGSGYKVRIATLTDGSRYEVFGDYSAKLIYT